MKIILLALLLILSPVASSLAAPAEMYVGEAVVENKQLAERKRALPLALLQVIQKLSGLRHFDRYPLVGPRGAPAEPGDRWPRPGPW